MTPEKIPIPGLVGYDCFACGTHNPIGLKMSFYRQGDLICSDVLLSRSHVGWQNMAHGGIISTLLDEVMSWSVIYFTRSFPVTRRMTVRYLRPVPVEVPLCVRGRMAAKGKAGGRRAEAALHDGKGRVLARAQGEFAILQGEKLSALPEDLRKDMLELFKKFV